MNNLHRVNVSVEEFWFMLDSLVPSRVNLNSIELSNLVNKIDFLEALCPRNRGCLNLMKYFILHRLSSEYNRLLPNRITRFAVLKARLHAILRQFNMGQLYGTRRGRLNE